MNYVEIEDKDFPKSLKNIKNPPDHLYYEGNINILDMPCITVVGSRNMTDYGEKMTRKIVKELTSMGICIVSGLAVGIDKVAHKTCLDNNGKTVAVLGSGLNNVFPPENYELYKKILSEGGCVLTEYSPNTAPEKSFFPRRNRIVSGLSIATLVVEATYRSGTAITAKFTFDQGKKVFCVPNCVGSKNSAGTIELIKKGAIIATSGEDILCNLGLMNSKQDQIKVIEKQKREKLMILEEEQLSKLDESTRRIYYIIKENKVVNAEILSSRMNEAIQTINMHLTILELKGLIVNKYGMNYVIRDDLDE